MKHTTIARNNDKEYGVAANGTHVGNGYDVIIKRVNNHTALLNVMGLASKVEWLGEIDVDENQNLQALAVEIGNCHGPWINSLTSNYSETESWDMLAARWDAIEVY